MDKKIIVNKRQLIFSEINISFSDVRPKKDIFTNKKNKTVKETLESKSGKYKHLKNIIHANYVNYLNYIIGDFLKYLKQNNDIFYLKFLNLYGDKIYSKFVITDKEIINEKGLYLYCINDDIKYIGKCTNNFRSRINAGYGNISPKNCYLDGQSTNCHINSLITLNKENIQLYILCLDNEEEINKTERQLINLYNPEWNIQK